MSKRINHYIVGTAKINMIVVDVETTGVNAWKNCIVSIGALDFENPENQFYEECRILEDAEVDPIALEINGFSEAEVRNLGKQSLEEILKKFAFWLEGVKDQTVAGQNPSFDREFLSVAARKTNVDLVLGRRLVDLHGLCFAHYMKRGLVPLLKENRSNIYADLVFEYVGLPREPKPHNGLNGAKWEAEAFSRLIRSKILLKEFEKYSLPDYLKQII